MKTLKYFLQLYKNMSFKNKLILVFSIQIIISMFFVLCIFYPKAIDVIKKDTINHSENILEMTALRLNDFSENVDKLIKLTADDQKIKNLLTMDTKKNDSFEYYTADNEVIQYIKTEMISRPEIQSATVVSNQNNFCTIVSSDTSLISSETYYSIYNSDSNDLSNSSYMSYSSYNPNSNNNLYSIEDYIPYSKIISNLKNLNGDSFWFFDKKGNNIQNIYLIKEIYDPNTVSVGRIGLVVFLIRKSYFESVFNALDKSTMKNVFILSKGNIKITGRNSSKLNLLSYIKDNKIESYKIKSKPGYYFDEKINMFVSYAKVNSNGWKTINFIPLNELYKEMNRFKDWFIVMIFCELIFLSFISMFMARDIVNPINKLVSAMKRVETGGKREQVLVERKDEIGFLSKSFNNMSSKIDTLIHGMYLEKITRREAQIKALQAQINPHFLFNTLESVNWLAQLNDVPEISDMVTALCSLMDAGVGRDDKLITINEELKYIDNYITIIKYRHGDRLTVKQNVDKELLNLEIPRLLLQPLVENATCHSVDKTRGEVIIEIRGYTKEQYAFIEVIDNGIGIEKEKILELNKKFNEDENSKGIKEKASKSVGTENVNRRVKLFFGEEFGLRVESEYGKYTKVIVKLPRHNNQDGGSYYV